VDRALVERAHAAGIRVNVWTVDDPSQYARYRELDLDKLCTNRLAELLAAAAATA
jgi:glycerophosphoryl diester phosphodiesterase